MITAVDSNVLIDILSDDPTFADASVRAIQHARNRGRVVACEVVWAEVAAWAPSVDIATFSMDQMGIDYVPLTRTASVVAGAGWARYRSLGGPRERVLPDFLVAAHAVTQADRLLTRDRGFYRRYFEDLAVVDPSRV